MRAAVLTELGAIPHPADLPEPPDGTEAVVDVIAVALSPIDITVGSGRFALGHPPMPYVIGHEAVVRSGGGLFYVAGSGIGITADGMCAEKRCVNPSSMIALPDGANTAIAAALGTAGVAGWTSVVKRAAVSAGETVAIRGASGAAGRIALQAARAKGAATVIAIGR
jgi:NADPH:quinone reductase-like Zn-dependent oxidoreductase